MKNFAFECFGFLSCLYNCGFNIDIAEESIALIAFVFSEKLMQVFWVIPEIEESCEFMCRMYVVFDSQKAIPYNDKCILYVHKNQPKGLF